MKIAATEALWDTEQPASFSLFQIGGFTVDDQTPSFSVDIPGLLSFLATNSFHGQVVGINELQAQAEQQYGPGNYIPDVRLVYWSMRVMAYLGTLSLLPRGLGRLGAVAQAARETRSGSSARRSRGSRSRSSRTSRAGCSRRPDASPGSSTGCSGQRTPSRRPSARGRSGSASARSRSCTRPRRASTSG